MTDFLDILEGDKMSENFYKGVRCPEMNLPKFKNIGNNIIMIPRIR